MAKAAISSEGVFKDDLILLDYLDALLSSAPPISLDLRPAYFKPQTTETVIKAAVDTTTLTIVNSSNNLTPPLESPDVELLRSENEHLKFKTELANIDAEVLRSENNKLIAELSLLKSKHCNTQTIVEKLRTENKDLKLKVEPLLAQVKTLTEIQTAMMLQLKEATSQPATESITVIDEAAQEMGKSVPKCNDSEQDQLKPEEQETHCMLKPKNIETTQISCEERRGFSSNPDPVIRINSTLNTDNSMATEVQTIKHPAILDELSQKRLIISSTSKSTKTTSKVIKQQNKHCDQDFEKKSGDLLVVEQNSIKIDEATTSNKVVQLFEKRNYCIEPEPQAAQKDDSLAPPQNIRKPLDTDEIDLEPATPSKVIIRKNARKYELLQKEADTTDKAPEYKITLVT